jgi:putative membrane protein
MYAAALMAFLHHLAAFTVVAALGAEIALFRPPLSLTQARRLLLTDTLFGVAAGLLLVVGLLRVAYFEKGWSYYWHDSFFLLKFAAFLAAALISIYPTATFASWNRSLKDGVVPQITPQRVQRVRLCLTLEALAIAVILLGAAFMARGFGYRG